MLCQKLVATANMPAIPRPALRRKDATFQRSPEDQQINTVDHSASGGTTARAFLILRRAALSLLASTTKSAKQAMSWAYEQTNLGIVDLGYAMLLWSGIEVFGDRRNADSPGGRADQLSHAVGFPGWSWRPVARRSPRLRSSAWRFHGGHLTLQFLRKHAVVGSAHARLEKKRIFLIYLRFCCVLPVGRSGTVRWDGVVSQFRRFQE